MKKILLAASLFILLPITANAEMILIGVFDGINDPENDTTILQDLTGTEFLAHLDRVDWNTDDTLDDPFTNTQTSGNLTITGTTFKEVPDSMEVIAFDWSYAGDNLDYITFKLDNWLAVYLITGEPDIDGIYSGSLDLQVLADATGCCTNASGQDIFSLSHSAGYSAVPIPAAVWLFGSGLLGLVGIARRKPIA